MLMRMVKKHQLKQKWAINVAHNGFDLKIDSQGVDLSRRCRENESKLNTTTRIYFIVNLIIARTLFDSGSGTILNYYIIKALSPLKSVRENNNSNVMSLSLVD